MQVDEKHVMTIRLSDTPGSSFALSKEGRGVRLTILSKQDAVHILLAPEDAQRLCREILKARGHEPVRPRTPRRTF